MLYRKKRNKYIEIQEFKIDKRCCDNQSYIKVLVCVRNEYLPLILVINGQN